MKSLSDVMVPVLKTCQEDMKGAREHHALWHPDKSAPYIVGSPEFPFFSVAYYCTTVSHYQPFRMSGSRVKTLKLDSVFSFPCSASVPMTEIMLQWVMK